MIGGGIRGWGRPVGERRTPCIKTTSRVILVVLQEALTTYGSSDCFRGCGSRRRSESDACMYIRSIIREGRKVGPSTAVVSISSGIDPSMGELQWQDITRYIFTTIQEPCRSSKASQWSSQTVPLLSRMDPVPPFASEPNSNLITSPYLTSLFRQLVMLEH